MSEPAKTDPSSVAKAGGVDVSTGDGLPTQAAGVTSSIDHDLKTPRKQEHPAHQSSGGTLHGESGSHANE